MQRRILEDVWMDVDPESTINITVCVGSSCYVRGSEALAETLSRLVRERGLSARVELVGAFCMDQCSMGVSVQVGNKTYRSVSPDGALLFFESEVMPCLKSPPCS